MTQYQVLHTDEPLDYQGYALLVIRIMLGRTYKGVVLYRGDMTAFWCLSVYILCSLCLHLQGQVRFQVLEQVSNSFPRRVYPLQHAQVTRAASIYAARPCHSTDRTGRSIFCSKDLQPSKGCAQSGKAREASIRCNSRGTWLQLNPLSASQSDASTLSVKSQVLLGCTQVLHKKQELQR